MKNDPPANKPPDGYEKNLQSILLLPMRKALETIMKESGYFKDISGWFLQPQTLISDAYYPTVFIIHPDGEFEPHGLSKQTKSTINLEFWLYTKHYERNINNELDWFIEVVIYLIMKNKSPSFVVSINGVDYTLCVSNIEPTGFSQDYAFDSRHIYRTATVTAMATVVFPLIAPPVP